MRTFRFHRGPLAGVRIRAWFPCRLLDGTGQPIDSDTANLLLNTGRGFYGRKPRGTTYIWGSMEGWPG